MRRRLTLVLAACAVLIAGLGPLLNGPLSEKEQLRDYGIVPPWIVYHAVLKIVECLDTLRNVVVPPQMRMIEHSVVFHRTQAAHVLAAFSIPDHLALGPKTTAELAQLAGIESEDGLWRVLRLAAVQGLLTGATDRAGVTRFRNNRLSATLRRDHPNSVRSFVLFQAQEVLPLWSSLVPALRSGKSAWEETYPQHSSGMWDYLKDRPQVEDLFSESMTATNSLSVPALLRDYRWEQFSRFIDIGGAHGSFLAALLRDYPTATGILSDLPQVVQRAKVVWKERYTELLPRVTFGPGGSFFDSGVVPKALNDKDVFILRTILHDWSDAKALRILQSVRSAIGSSNATLALLEIAPRDGLAETFENYLYMDVQMFVTCDGRERGKAQWDQLFRASGFRMTGLIVTRGSLKVVEAMPV